MGRCNYRTIQKIICEVKLEEKFNEQSPIQYIERNPNNIRISFGIINYFITL